MAFSQDGQRLSIQALTVPDGGEIPLFASRTVLQMLLKRGEIDTKGLFLQMPFARRATSEGIQLTGDGADLIPAGVGPVSSFMRVGYVLNYIQPTVYRKTEIEADSSGEDVKVMALRTDSTALLQDIEFWRLNGAIRDASGNNGGILRTAGAYAGMQTLNGNVTWSNAADSGTTDRGFWQQLVPASQTGNVQGLAVGSDFTNQYQAGASWSAGTTTAALINQIIKLRGFGAGAGDASGLPMKVDSGIADDVSFARLQTYLQDNVRVVDTSKDQFGGEHDFLPYMGVKIYNSPLLNPEVSSWSGTDAASTGATDGGLIYIFASKALQSRMSVKESTEWERVVGGPQVKSVASVLLAHQLVCQRLPLIGGISKTRIA